MLPIAVLLTLIGFLARSWVLSFTPAANAMERFTPAAHFEPIPAPGPSDWLANHPEPGQTFEQYRRERVNRPDKVRRKLAE